MAAFCNICLAVAGKTDLRETRTEGCFWTTTHIVLRRYWIFFGHCRYDQRIGETCTYLFCKLAVLMMLHNLSLEASCVPWARMYKGLCSGLMGFSS